MIRYKLLDIEWVEAEWQMHRRIKALEVNGRCEVIDSLSDWKQSSIYEFKKILTGVKLVLSRNNYIYPNRTETCIGYEPMFEIKNGAGGKARIFCYPLDELNLLVAIGTHWKDPKRQDADMSKASERMNNFLEWRERNDE